MPKQEYEELFADSFGAEVEEFEADDTFSEPADTDEFDAESVPGYSDGDYPPWIATEQDLYLPEEVLGAFGVSSNSVLNGPFWTIDPSKRQQVLMALKAMGYELTEREDLQFW